ncbi:MAG: thioredoxin domain-containing protein [Ornithinibacter sp.]
MAKNSTRASGTARQAKIQAAQEASGGGVNKIVVATGVAIVAIIAVVGGVVWSQTAKDKAAGTSTAVPAGAAMGEGYPAFTDATPAVGAPTVDLYEDFQCPVCGQFEGILGATIGDLAGQGKIKVNYHVLNFLDDKTGAQNSTPAANGAFCAADDGKFQEFHNAVYTNQAPEGTNVDDSTLAAWAATAGINGDALGTWKACVDAGTYTKYVTSVNDAAFKISGFSGTPTVMINGTMTALKEIGTPEAFTKAVEAATT